MNRSIGRLRAGTEFARRITSPALGRFLLYVVIASAPIVLSSGRLGSNFVLNMGALTAIYAVAVMGLNIIYGWSGQVSLGHGAFFGLGAYVTGFLTGVVVNEGGLEDSIGLQLLQLGLELFVVVCASLLLGLLIGLPAVRISGLQLIIITFGLSQLFQWSLLNWQGVTGGLQGLLVAPIELPVFNTADPRGRYLVAVLIAAMASMVMSRIRRAPVGRSMVAVRDSELMAESIGVWLPGAKVKAFCLGAVYAGVAGWMLAHHAWAVTPGSFGTFTSIFLLAAVIIGGRGSVVGSWLGAAYLVILPEFVRTLGLDGLYPLISGVLLIAILIATPGGLVSLFVKVLPRPGVSAGVHTDGPSNPSAGYTFAQDVTSTSHARDHVARSGEGGGNCGG